MRSSYCLNAWEGGSVEVAGGEVGVECAVAAAEAAVLAVVADDVIVYTDFVGGSAVEKTSSGDTYNPKIAVVAVDG